MTVHVVALVVEFVLQLPVDLVVEVVLQLTLVVLEVAVKVLHLILVVGVGLAAFTLNLDFEDISQGAATGLPREYEWKAAFGLVVTMIWLYIEILRLLSIFNRD